MKVIKCWDIQVWDGGDRHNHKYYVATKEAADEWKAKNKFDEIYEKELVILDSWDELQAYKDGELRKRALAKLTDAEKVVLGLK
jgi:hypothetical protein